ncbi:MAG: response regulator transcription factor [Tomitella sp.]|nr:response regulator transcription factor [Tomitella sp.]
MITVAVVDDQQLVRAGFAMVIDSQSDMTVAWQADNGHDALLSFEADPVDVVIMDIQMPQLDGIDATRRILAANPHARVIVLTTFDIDRYVLDAIAAGASGFLLKDAEPEELLSAIRAIHGGDSMLSARSTRRLLDHVRDGWRTRQRSDPENLDQLTRREREFLQHIALGRTNTELAQEMFVSEATVKTHVGNILAKTGSRDRVQAILLAFKAGLVDPEDIPT